MPFTATFTGDGTLGASLSMSPAGVCDFSGWGVVFKAPGSCTVTLTQAASATYEAASISKTFTVS